MTARFGDLAMWLGKMPLAVQAALLIALALSVALPLRRVMKSLKSEVRPLLGTADRAPMGPRLRDGRDGE